MVVCIACTFNRIYGSNRLANPARGQLDRQGKLTFHCPRCSRLRLWFRETGSAAPFRVGMLIVDIQTESRGCSRDYSRFPRRRLHNIPSTSIGSVPTLTGDAIAYRWRSLPSVRRYRASIVLKVIQVTGAAFSGFTMDQVFIYASFSFSTPTTIGVMKKNISDA